MLNINLILYKGQHWYLISRNHRGGYTSEAKYTFLASGAHTRSICFSFYKCRCHFIIILICLRYV